MIFFRLRTWQSGVKSLLLHPLRSLLTILGIFIGTASVIWLLAIGEGISAKAQQQIAELGAENVILKSVQPMGAAGGGGRLLKKYGLTRADYDRLTTIPTIERAVRIRETRRECKYLDRSVDARLVACTPEYEDLNRLSVDRGHFLTDAELREAGNVCVLAAEVAEHLFQFEDPIGRTIHIHNDYYTVVGVMRPKTATAAVGGSMAGQDFADDVYVPVTTFWQRISGSSDMNTYYNNGSRTSEILELNQITLRSRSGTDVLQTSHAVRDMLKAHHPDGDYAVVVPLELLEQAKNTRLMFIVFMGLIAAVSLVVGGIGIMNIMLATVTERTREIGIRRALGAKRSDITRQFLVETVALSVAGGLTGVAGGLTCGPVFRGLRALLESTMPQLVASMPESIRDVSPIIVPASIPLAFGISVAVGVIFGLYPARRAARMNPIEALRHVA